MATKKTFERPTTILPHVMAFWKDSNLIKRISIRIQLLSGENPVRLVNWRVSTDQKAFIIGVKLDETFMTPEQAFYCLTLAGVKDTTEHHHLKLMLQHHPKTLAYREAVSRLNGRDHNKDVVVDEARFPLPFKVQHRFTTKSEDPLFNGIKTETKQNGVQFLHVELIGDMIDGYSPMKGSLSSSFVASVSSLKSPPVVVGGPLSAHDEDDDESDEDYTYLTFADSKLEVDTLDEMSIATTNWAEKSCTSKKSKMATSSNKMNPSPASIQFSTSSKKIRVKKSTALAIRTGCDTLTVAEGALSPLRICRGAKRQKTSNPGIGSKRSAPKGLSSNGTVA
jgi:hypothetical protein